MLASVFLAVALSVCPPRVGVLPGEVPTNVTKDPAGKKPPDKPEK